jgi:hypothetical protein
MTRLAPSRLIAILAACTAVPVLVGSVWSADDGILTVARLDEVTASVTTSPVAPADTVLEQGATADESGLPPRGPLADRLAPLPEHPDLATVRSLLDAYRRGDLSGGDALASRLTDPAARTLARWAALRLLPRDAGYARIQAFLAEEPAWPGRTQLHRRAEEALLASGPRTDRVLAHFARHAPLTAMGKLALARAWAATGHAAEAAALISPQLARGRLQRRDRRVRARRFRQGDHPG